MGYREVILATPGLATYHRMIGGASEASIGPDTATMTHTGSPVSVPGLIRDANGAVSYNGSSQYSTFSSAWAAGLSAMSIEFWFRETGRVDWSWLFGVDDNPLAQFSVVRRAAEDNLICGYSTAGGGSGSALVGPYKPLDRNYVAYTLGGGTLNLYINGVLCSTATGPGTMGTGARTWRVAGSGNPSQYLNGVTDEVATYTATLSPTTVARHYKAGLASGVLNGLLLPV